MRAVAAADLQSDAAGAGLVTPDLDEAHPAFAARTDQNLLRTGHRPDLRGGG
ncbi:hypothetical protein JOD57_000848 [Geodermatophilus bullaregiensis]|nr:hypothetical protein [Geodermatophilus bullaregiensis]